MYASVKEYGGFYIARYEAGIDSKRNSVSEELITGSRVHFKMNKIPYNNIMWNDSDIMNDDTGGIVEVARGIYTPNNTFGIVSTLTYGVEWDTILQWWKTLDSEFDVTNSKDYGNFKEHEISSANDLNEGALVWDYTADSSAEAVYVSKDSTDLTYPKNSETSWALSTGALKASNIKNIYDMAGNLGEFTMEGAASNYRIYRSGTFGSNASSVASRGQHMSSYGSYYVLGFRIALYIK